MERAWFLKGIIIAVSIILVFSGCGNKKETTNEKLQVVATIYPMYEFASKVSGPYADVTLLVSSGLEPHDWEPTAQDLMLLESADVLVYNGAGMEGWLEEIVDSVKNPNLILLEASQGIALLAGDRHDHDEHDGHDEHDHDHNHDHGVFDPHVWLSPALAAEQVKLIEEGLSKAAPELQENFKKNAASYIAELEALDQRFKETLSPYKGKPFVTQHAAFAYLANEYQLVQQPIAGLSPDIEPSAERMADIVEYARKHEIKTIFFESLVSSKVASVIADEIGAETAVLHPLETLTEEEEAAGNHYIQLMEHNLRALEEAFKNQ